MKQRTFILTIALAALLIGFGVPATCLAGTYNIFVRVDGIEGESRDEVHGKWIDTFACSDSILMPIAPIGGGGGGTSRPNFADIRIIKGLDKASPGLRHDAATGEHIPRVFIEFTLKTDSHSIVLRITLEDVLVSEVSMTANTLDAPQEVVAFNFRRVTWEYRQVLADGTLGPVVRFGYDLYENRPI